MRTYPHDLARSSGPLCLTRKPGVRGRDRNQPTQAKQPKMDGPHVDVDRVLLQFGKFGRFQLLNYMALSIPLMISAMYTVAYTFEAEDLEYRCLVPECEDTSSSYLPDWLPNAVPYEDGEPSECERYVPTEAILNDTSRNCSAAEFSKEVEQCLTWVFEPGQRSTILNEWNLTCDENEWKLTFVGTINNIGLFVGMPVAGFISDRFGRKILLFWAWALCSLMGILRSLALSYEMFITFEFLDAFFGAGVYGAGFLLALELVGPKSRVFAATVLSCFYSGGGVIMGAIAWGVQDWRWFLRAMYIPGLLCLPLIWLAPESVRWLVSQGRFQEANKIVLKVAAINRVNVTETFNNSVHQNEEKEKGNSTTPKDNPGCSAEGGTISLLLRTLKSRTLLLRFINCAYCWMANTFVYYGLSLYSVSLAGNEYLNYMLSSAVELPADVLQLWLMNTIGRRFSLSGSMIVSGICCLCFLGLPDDLQWLRLTVYMIGKFAITMSFDIVYVFTAEMFPTHVRNSLVGYGSMFGRIGSMLAPQTPLLETISEQLPLATFGGVSLLSGILALLFPETKDQALPESIEEAVEMGKKCDDNVE